MISDHKGCNIPKGNLSVDIVTPKDRKDLQLIAQLNPEYLAASFVEKAEHISLIRGILKEFGNETIKIIAKIERPIALGTYLFFLGKIFNFFPFFFDFFNFFSERKYRRNY